MGRMFINEKTQTVMATGFDSNKQQRLAPGTVIRGLQGLRPWHRGSVVTLGTFDGVHLGHQAILRQVNTKARALNLPSVVVIFEPQPHEFFSGERAPARLMRFREKLLALFAAGVDRVLCLHFNRQLSRLSAREFVETTLIEGLGVQHLVIGDDFHFGSDRCGDYAFLQQMGTEFGFDVTDTHTFEVDGARVSSTRIRAVLDKGDFTEAARLLGRPYRISGYVQQGQKLGRQLGAPTANVNLRRYRSPLAGVFAVRVAIPDGSEYNGVANIGVRPTVNGLEKPILEVNLFDFSGELYGQLIEVEFKKKLRAEQRFESVDALKAQIQRDMAQARACFANGID